MSKGPFLTDRKWRHGRAFCYAGFGIVGSAVALAALAQAAPDQHPASVVRAKSTPAAPAPATAPHVIPFAVRDRLARIDQLQAELAQLKIEGEIAKVKADIRNAAAGTNGAAPATGALIPPLPTLTGQNFNLPPLPTVSLEASPRGSKPVPAKPALVSYSMVEAWGSGGDRQAVVRVEGGGPRIIRVGDHLGTELVTAIGNGVVSLRGPRGKVRTIN